MVRVLCMETSVCVSVCMDGKYCIRAMPSIVRQRTCNTDRTAPPGGLVQGDKHSRFSTGSPPPKQRDGRPKEAVAASEVTHLTEEALHAGEEVVCVRHDVDAHAVTCAVLDGPAIYRLPKGGMWGRILCSLVCMPASKKSKPRRVMGATATPNLSHFLDQLPTTQSSLKLQLGSPVVAVKALLRTSSKRVSITSTTRTARCVQM
jgi:hypothetical protein